MKLFKKFAVLCAVLTLGAGTGAIMTACGDTGSYNSSSEKSSSVASSSVASLSSNNATSSQNSSSNNSSVDSSAETSSTDSSVDSSAETSSTDSSVNSSAETSSTDSSVDSSVQGNTPHVNGYDFKVVIGYTDEPAIGYQIQLCKVGDAAVCLTPVNVASDGTVHYPVADKSVSYEVHVLAYDAEVDMYLSYENFTASPTVINANYTGAVITVRIRK